MRFFLIRVLPALIFTSIFILVVYFIPPPPSWAEASIFQILIFFLPLLIALTLLLNIFLRLFSKSFSIALGLMVLVVLRSVDELNIVTIFLTITLSYLLSTTFKRPPWQPRKIAKLDKTSTVKIPKLRLRNYKKDSKLKRQ